VHLWPASSGSWCRARCRQGPLSAEELDARIKERFPDYELVFLDGVTFAGLRQLNKMVREAMAEETGIYTAESARFIHGAGVKGAGS
jgi:thermospermine synthase